MRDSELVFRDRLDKLLGKYCPNDATLNILAFYLFREAADVLRSTSKEGIETEVQSIQPNQSIETPSFNKAIRDVSAFTSQKMMTEVIKKAYSEVKSLVPMVQRGTPVGDGMQTVQTKPYARQLEFSQNGAEFDIDLSAIPKVGISKIRQVAPKKVEPTGFVSNVFSGDVQINVDEINMRTPKAQKEDDIPTSDASSYTDGTVYSGVPKVEVSLDY